MNLTQNDRLKQITGDTNPAENGVAFYGAEYWHMCNGRK